MTSNSNGHLWRSLFIANILVVSGFANAAQVESLSSEILKHKGDDAFWQVDVKCEGNLKKVSIRQTLRQFDWCRIDEEMPCEATKQKMAEQVCLSFKSLVTPPKLDKVEKRQIVSVAPFSSSSSVPAPIPQSKQSAPETSNSRTEALRQNKERLNQAAKARQAEKRARENLLRKLRNDQLTLQKERTELNAEKLEIQVQEAELNSQASQIQNQLRMLDN